MKLLPSLTALVAAAAILPSVVSGRIWNNGEVSLVRKGYRPRAPEVKEHVPATNAERFARGLPPLSPSKSRNRGTPTRRDVVSPIPPVTYRGIIEMYYKDGSLDGYVGNNGINNYTISTTDITDALVVSFSLPVGQTSGSGLNLLMENSQLPTAATNPYLGFTGTQDIYNSLESGVYLRPTPETQGPAVLVPYDSSYTYAESSVWSINVATGEMIVVWTNSDGTTVSSNSNPIVDLGNDIPIIGGYTGGGGLPEVTFKFVQI